MIRNVLNQFECKIGKAGEILCNTDDIPAMSYCLSLPENW